MIDLTLNNLSIPGIPDYQPPFGKKKADYASLSTAEVNTNVLLPFSSQRAISFDQSENISKIERNSSVVYVGSQAAVLDLREAVLYAGCKLTVVNTTGYDLSIEYLDFSGKEQTFVLTAGSIELNGVSVTAFSMNGSVWSGSKAQYDSLGTWDDEVIYIVKDE